ncbi:MAG: hypothetical protein ACR2OZ_01915 [Verrucomicrobiales bacterium]
MKPDRPTQAGYNESFLEITARNNRCVIMKMFQPNFWLAKRTVVRRRLTWPALVIGLAISVTLCVGALHTLHPVLAVNSPLDHCDVLVVEGWAPDYAVAVAADSFRRGETTRLFTTGIPIERGGMLVPWQNFANVAEATLVKLGVADERIIPVATPARRKDRTEASAESLKAAIEQTELSTSSPRRFNVLTLGPHARRTQLVYRRTFGKDWEIGIISVPSQEYDPEHWWRSSAGVKAVAGEALALVYTWFR